MVSLTMILIQSSCTEEGMIEPEADARDKFVGTWSVKEESKGIVQNYTSTITKAAGNPSQIRIGNIFNLSEPIQAVVSEKSVTLVNSSISGFEIKGSGIYSGGSFVLNYSANDGSGDRLVKATYTK